MGMNIHHIGIKVRDFDKMLRFYEKAFGFKTLGYRVPSPEEIGLEASENSPSDSSMQVVMMQAGNCYLEIMGNPDAPVSDGSVPPLGYTQICVDVDDIEREYERLKGLGMTFGSPLQAPGDFGHVKAVTGFDPEGNAFELVQTISDWDCNLAELLPVSA